MGRGRHVEDRHLDAARADEVQDRGDQDPGSDRPGLARLQVDLEPRSLAEVGHELDQQLDVVARSGDVVPAPHVEPADPVEPAAELGLDHRERPLERVRAQLAQGVEVKPRQLLEPVGLELGGRDPQPGARGAGVVEGDLHLAVLGVEPQPELDLGASARAIGPRPSSWLKELTTTWSANRRTWRNSASE